MQDSQIRSQSFLEGLSVKAIVADDMVPLRELMIVEVVVVFDRVSQVEDDGFLRFWRGHGMDVL